MTNIENQKFKVIKACDYLEKHYAGTVYFNDLKQLRQKYIFKDISRQDLIYDKDYLRKLWYMTKNKK